MSEISKYKNRFATTPIGTTSVDLYLDNIKDGTWQDFVLAVRNGKGNKDDAEGVTVSALFDANRRNDSVRTHSGFLAIDLDEGDNPYLPEVRGMLEADPYCYACHHSIRGFGLVWYVKISPEKHLEAFEAIEKYLANKYNVIADPSGKNVSRLRYISYDPDLFRNRKSKKWTSYIPKKEREVPQSSPIPYHTDDMSHIMDQIGAGKNIAEDYHSWIRIGFALASEFGETGRGYFHTVSAQSAKYDKDRCDRQFNLSLKREGSVGMGTFFHYCKEAGVDIRTPETSLIESVGKQRLRMAGQHGSRKEAIASAREYLTKMEGLATDRVDAVLDKIKDLSPRELKPDKVDDKLVELENFIRTLGLRRNQIMGQIERDGGTPLKDPDLNEYWRKAMHAVDPNLPKHKLVNLIESDLVESYDPFMEFFKKHREMKPQGRIQEVLECFEYEKPDIPMSELDEDEELADYLEVFLTRWLVSIISSAHGTYSLLVLVLVGDQGTGKTKFFRSLLPPELREYYAESKLDKEKDDGILMCQKLIIVDDEFSGKNKKEADKFKEIVSRETFTVRKPYGRFSEDMKRIAVLGGTTNEKQILNDMTGNRRIIPVNVIDFDHKRFEAIDKTELFMELYWTWKEIGDAWMLGQKEIAYLNKSTTSSEQVSFEAELLLKWFEPQDQEGGNTVFCTTSEIKNRIDIRTNERINLFKLGAALRKYGFKRIKKRIGSRTPYGYLVVDSYQGKESGPVSPQDQDDTFM